MPLKHAQEPQNHKPTVAMALSSSYGSFPTGTMIILTVKMDELLVRLLFECTGCMINPLHSGVSCMDCCGIWGATHPGFVVTTRGVDGTRPLCREKWICNTSQTHCQIHVLLSSEKCFSLNMCELLRWCKSSLLHFLKCVHNMYMMDMEDRNGFADLLSLIWQVQ